MADDAEVAPSPEAPATGADAETADASANVADAPAAESNVPMDIVDSDLEEIDATVAFDIGDELEDEPDSGNFLDAERLAKEAEAFPALHTLEQNEPEGRKAKVFAKYQQEAADALKSFKLTMAIDKYTEGMRIVGCTPVLLAQRAALLLKQKRPCAAIRDCSAAIKVNPHILQAYRIRGIAHRKLGHWKKAHRDLSEAQNLNWDQGTADVHKFVTQKLGIEASPRKESGAPQQSAEAALNSALAAVPKSPDARRTNPFEYTVENPAKEFDKLQAVFICGLKNASHLNGRRGVVQRPDPRPQSRGRWEVEVRLDCGRTEIKSLNPGNIMTLNKADKPACRAWMRQEKKHLEEVNKQEKTEEAAFAQKRFEAKMVKLSLSEQVKNLLRQLKIEDALELLEKAGESEVRNPNLFLANQAKMRLGAVDSSSDEEAVEDKDEGDTGRLPEDEGPYPEVPYFPECEPTESQTKLTNEAKRKAQRASEKSDLPGALRFYTEAVEAGGAAALMLAKRGELLLKMKRPNAAIHDCTAALEINSDCTKAFHVRGMANRTLGHWEEANDDLCQGQKLDFDEAVVKTHDFVKLKVNKMQERGVKRRRKEA